VTDREHPYSPVVTWATTRPTELAIVASGTELTWAEANDTAVRLAYRLREQGVRSGDVVAVALPALLETTMILALLHEGAVSCTLPSISGTENDAPFTFDWLITTPSSTVSSPDRARRTIIVDDPWIGELARASARPDPRGFASGDDLCRIVFSSGTTGAPKGVPFTVDTIGYRTRSARQYWMPLRPFMCLLPVNTVSGFQTFYASVSVGDCYRAPGSAADNLRVLADHQVRSIKASPMQLSELLTEAHRVGATLPHLSIIQSAGSPLPTGLARGLEQHFDAEVVNLYGSSESGTVAIRRGGGDDAQIAGTIVDDVEVQIVDENDEVLPDGEVGLVRITRPHQPTGYVSDDEASRAAFRDCWFYPGDRGSVRDGTLTLHGRASELINAAGVKIDPARIEAQVLTFSGIDDAAGCSVPGAHGVETFALAFIGDPDVDIAALSASLRAAFGESAPGLFVRVAEIPRTATGKVVRRELSAQLLRITYAEPRE
jgi:acyl-coenzyme A synthetase/AMP-(fatty) acid ligase